MLRTKLPSGVCVNLLDVLCAWRWRLAVYPARQPPLPMRQPAHTLQSTLHTLPRAVLHPALFTPPDTTICHCSSPAGPPGACQP